MLHLVLRQKMLKKNNSLTKKAIISIAITLSILFLDQSTKIWVKTNMIINQEFPLIGSWLQIHFVENPGMAMGLSFGGEIGKYSLTLFRIIAIIVLTGFIFRFIRRGASTLVIILLSLVYAGAIGNVIDCLFYGMVFTSSYGQVAEFVPWGMGYSSFMQGNVVDMISVRLFKIPRFIPIYGGLIFFPFIFNVADAAISLSVVLMLIFQKKIFPTKIAESQTN